MAQIPVGRERFALVDDEDAPFLSKHKWYEKESRHPRGTFYAQASIKGRTVYMHRLILGAAKGQIVDHINRNKLDNRRCNLRFCTPVENAWNAAHPLGASGFRGVAREKRTRNSWTARLEHKGRVVYIGSYRSAEEAARARDVVARQLFGGFAVLNFPEADKPQPVEAA
jgi:hypothetical protein